MMELIFKKYLADNFNVDVSTIYNILKNKYYATT